MKTIMEEVAMKRLPARLESFSVPTRFGDTYVNASGPKDAPPLVLIAAMGVTSKMWLPNLAALSCGYRTYALDTIGDQGRSILYNPEQYPKNGRAYSEWLADMFDELGIEQADLIGASYGGWMAMNHAIYAPRRVKRLVLLGAMGLPSWWTTLKVLSHLWSVFLLPTRSNIDRMIRWALGETPQVREAFAEFITMGAKGYSRFRLAPPVPIPDEHLRKIKAPTLLMLGERDNVIGDANKVGDRAKRVIPHVQVEVIPEAGHMLSTECVEIVNGSILYFLKHSQ